MIATYYLQMSPISSDSTVHLQTSDSADPTLSLFIRAALIAGLNYVLSLSLVWAVNVKPLFALLFVCAGVWGWRTTIVAAVFTISLWTFANPFGPAPLPVAAAQIVGALLAAICCLAFCASIRRAHRPHAELLASSCGLLATTLFFVTVNAVDAYINQPFWPWFVTGMSFSLLSIASSLLLFPLVVPVIRRIRRLRFGME